ncbi:MAG TPA: aminotransferase [Elusimicrobia bacterium]|nr:MAG: aminotransferase [Elusimicrobia bacterium RIFOXYA12_FULL_49_49]OGS14877.1 MAG: aminotransferase [Elusimicrobia bacterium RIFOXYA2_FULL_47_53]OGS26492.1 MAG: aminotransferase [Elusimicrobia bacterium RIFOXYB12_FULL_50_12]OGS29845.1 MAG: aminotransferase [Elusimicrobia bacterium RIFOXYB2_FULL_46_23]HBU69019.1 aminotransferase [Elusimicrobiota bacterium]
MPQTSDRLGKFTESVIRSMTRLSNKYGAVNLSQGFPDFDPPEPLLKALEKAALKGPHQYAVTWGAENFRKALALKHQKFSGTAINPETNIVVTCGSTEAMMAAMMAACNPGDKVIVFSPFYENYVADAVLSGAEAIYVPLYPPDFGFDREELKRAFRKGPKAIVLCNPSNPTGKVFNKEELEYIASLAMEYDTFVITDEVYEHIVYEPNNHLYMSALPGMFERTIVCGSLSKTYAITGWRLGYILASEKIINAARKVHDFLTVGAAAPLQEAAVTALGFPESYYGELKAKYTGLRDIFLGHLDRAGLKYSKPQGAYYVLVDIEPLGWKDDVKFSEWLVKEIGVAGVPGSSFFHEPVKNLIRFHFAKKRETLDEAGNKLMKLKSIA